MNIIRKVKSLERIKNILDYNGYITTDVETVYQNKEPIVGFYFLGKLKENYRYIGHYKQIVRLYIYCREFNDNNYYFLTNCKIVNFLNSNDYSLFTVQDHSGVESKICDEILYMILQN